jgi:hypothetical protein
VITTIISCRQRVEARERTIQQLEAVGIEPIVFLSPCDETQPAGGRGNAIVSAQALQAAIDHDSDLLFCEDDIDLAADFGRFLGLAIQAKRVTYLYLHDVAHYMGKRYGAALTQAILNREPIRAGLHPLGETRNLSGTQCVYLPREFLQGVQIRTLSEGSRPIDVWLSHTLHADNTPALVALPHPVQHRQVRVARRLPNALNPDKYSRSFELERRWA